MSTMPPVEPREVQELTRKVRGLRWLVLWALLIGLGIGFYAGYLAGLNVGRTASEIDMGSVGPAGANQ